MISNKKIKNIQFEYGGTYIQAGIFLKDIFIYLQEKDYKIYKIFPKNIVLVDKYEENLENFQYSNYIAKL